MDNSRDIRQFINPATYITYNGGAAVASTLVLRCPGVACVSSDAQSPENRLYGIVQVDFAAEIGYQA